ncbi:MAG: winged helix-turn-helix domain-containing protein [Lysobacterales bacterium]|jgi:TolB-like protein/DNA-binding winged helix-turn-helix (wHTH) protein/tetratricopeptide (TPR) repeat protein
MASEHPKTVKEPFALGSFRVEPSRRIISGPDGETTIEPKIMAVLQMLAARRGEVVTRQEFIESIWATEFGGDESLTRAVSQLRKIFGDGHRDHHYIETVPKTGYRLTAGVGPPPSSGNRRERSRLLAPIVAVLLAILAATVYFREQPINKPRPEAPDGKTSVMLAVLPFDIQGGTSQDEPLAFGVADEILSALSRNPSIAVIAGNSSFQFQGDSKKDVAAVGEKLHVNYVVDGSLRRSTEGLRVGVYLIDTGTGLVEWSDVVTRPEDEIYSIPGEVAASVETALGAEPVIGHRPIAAPDPAAYQSYLYAKSLLRTPWGDNLDRAIKALVHAVTVDPSLSEAWSTLAITRVEMGFSSGPARPGPGDPIWSERLRAARQDAETALAIDAKNVEARLALTLVDYREEAVSLAETVQRMRSLLASAPNHPKVNFRMGMLMDSVGRFQDGIRYFGRALALDPLTMLNAALYGDALLCSGHMDEAMAFIRAQGVYERYQRTYTGLVMNLLAGDFQAAREGFTELGPKDIFIVDGVIELPTMNVDSRNTQRMSELMATVIDVAEQADVTVDPELVSKLDAAADEGLILHFYVAQLLAAAGLQDAALDLVGQRIAAGDSLVRESGILLRPAFSAARQNPSILKWLDVTGQLEYWLQTESWPDYCKDPGLPYDCAKAGRQFRKKSMTETSAASTL